MVKAPAPNKYSAEVSARLESMVGVDPREALEKLRAAQDNTSALRRQASKLKAELAMYEARYGYPSHWEHERKALLARLANHERNRLEALGEKVREAALEEYAHAHNEYRSLLNEARRERDTMERLRAELVDVQNQIEVARGAETYFAEQVRLNNALIYHSAREASL